MTAMIDVDDFINGGGGAPSAKFPNHGDTHKGKVVSSEVQQQTEMGTGTPLYWDNGKPRRELVITIDTGVTGDHDTTERRLFAKGKMLDAIREALGGQKLLPGGELTVRYVEDGESTTRGFSPPKLYKAKWVPPTTADLDIDDL